MLHTFAGRQICAPLAVRETFDGTCGRVIVEDVTDITPERYRGVVRIVVCIN